MLWVIAIVGAAVLAAVIQSGKYDLELLCGGLGFLLGLTLLNIP